MGALDGLLVVSLEQAVAAPFVSSRLLSTVSLPILSGSIEEKSQFQWI